MRHPKITADLRDALGSRLEPHRRGSGDHSEALGAEPSQLGNHLLRQPVTEIVVFVAGGEVLERQDQQHIPAAGTLRRIGSRALDRRNEPVTALWYSLDELDVVCCKCLTQLGNMRSEASVLNHDVGPELA